MNRAAIAVAFLLLAGCADMQRSTWTLWYVPNEPRQGTSLAKLCHTFVFAKPPDAKNFRVAVVKGVAGNGLDEAHAYTATGDSFDGALDLGPGIIRNENAGYDLKVDVVYRIDNYLMAKARADADCPR